MGKRIDVLLIIDGILFVLEFKIGESQYNSNAIDQVFDYALDLKNFHKESHPLFICPILICTKAKKVKNTILLTPHNDKLFYPLKCNEENIDTVIQSVLENYSNKDLDIDAWEKSIYSPSPTIVEAAMALYNGHSVTEISRSDSGATNLTKTSLSVSALIEEAKEKSKKYICFVTGVPGAGKTLVGLNIATKYINKDSDLYSVFLSGNGPLVDILREALTRDKFQRDKKAGLKVKKGEVSSRVKMFIQILIGICLYLLKYLILNLVPMKLSKQ